MSYAASTILAAGIDTGNRCIKTRNSTFIAGVQEVDPKFGLSDKLLTYQGKSYMLTTTRGYQESDKTKTNNYFVLSLFAIQHEIEARNIAMNSNEPLPVFLAVGLPPRDMARLRDNMKRYFRRGITKFSYAKRTYLIDIRDVVVLPQALAAVYNDIETIKQFPTAYVVDIGGYTTDVAKFVNGNIDPSFFCSYDMGMIEFFNKTSQQIQQVTGKSISELDLDRTLEAGKDILRGIKIYDKMFQLAGEYFNSIAGRLLENSVDLTISQGIFAGGGSIRLSPIIQQSNMVTAPIFINSIAANATGFEMVARAKAAGMGYQVIL